MNDRGITFHLYIYASFNSFFILIRLVCKYYALFHLSRHACTISIFFFFSFFFGESFLFLFNCIFLCFSGIVFFQVPVISLSLCKIVYITFTFYSVGFIFMILNTYDSLVLKFECKKLLTKLRNFNLLQKRNIIINNIFKFSLRIRSIIILQIYCKNNI